MSIKDAMTQAYLPVLEELTGVLREKADQWALVPMLGKTHGQPASPTRMGKEIKVFVERLENQSELLKTIPYSAKFGGATGNFNAHHVAYPDVDWVLFADKFLGINWDWKGRRPPRRSNIMIIWLPCLIT